MKNNNNPPIPNEKTRKIKRVPNSKLFCSLLSFQNEQINTNTTIKIEILFRIGTGTI